MKHTPGPWAVSWTDFKHRKGALGNGPGSDCDPARCKPVRVELSDTGSGPWAGIEEIHVIHNGSVDDILGADGDHVVCFGHDYDDYGGLFNEADAHLIAAAPEMLHALQCLLVYADNYAEQGNEKDSAWRHAEMARAAIAKAEGRSGVPPSGTLK